MGVECWCLDLSKIAKGINKYMCECILQNKQICIFYKKRLEGLDMACTPLLDFGLHTKSDFNSNWSPVWCLEGI